MNKLMMKLVSTIIVLTALSMTPASRGERLYVLAKGESLESLSKWQLRQIYLENGVNHSVKPLNLTIGSVARAVFNSSVIGLTESRIRSYWTQKKFTGRGEPPREFDSVADLLAFMEQNPGYIGYVPEAQVPEQSSLQVVFTIDY